MKAQLILENGKRFFGEMFGAEKDVAGEVVFTTGMIGYQETLTDSAYAGQLVAMTFPVVGNYGINFDTADFGGLNAAAAIVREHCEKPSNFRSEMTLSSFLKQKNIVGISGIDTRELTRLLRDEGTMKGVIVTGEPADAEIQKLFDTIDDSDFIIKATTKETYIKNPEGEGNTVVIDLGSGAQLAEAVAACGSKVTVLRADEKDILKSAPDTVIISDGPVNPENAPGTIDAVKAILGKVPVLGIAMGAQVLALAMGGEVSKMKFGHHGANQPVKDIKTGKVLITSQSHSYVISKVPAGAEAVYLNVNDGTCEGFEESGINVLGVQFAPGAELKSLISRVGKVK